MKDKTQLASILSTGNYSSKQLGCHNSLISWSHASRFRLGRKLLTPFAGRSLLDYGCGDGTFLAMNHDLFPKATGLDNSDKQIKSNIQRFQSLLGIDFVMETSKQFDVITCMEVLEHCVEPELSRVIENLSRLLSSDGTLLVSVPIEIGPPLLAKQTVRKIAGWMKLGDYKYNEPYSWRELLKMLFADGRTVVHRPVYSFQETPTLVMSCHPHKGFNWKALLNKLNSKFTVERTVFSPLPWFKGLVNSQVFFICKHKLS